MDFVPDSMFVVGVDLGLVSAFSSGCDLDSESSELSSSLAELELLLSTFSSSSVGD